MPTLFVVFSMPLSYTLAACSVIAILFVSTPFQIASSIVGLVFVDMVYLIATYFSLTERFGNYPMDGVLLSSSPIVAAISI